MTRHRPRGFAVAGTLILASLLLSHDLIYVLVYGPGDGYARAMTEAGHDSYWTSFTLTVTAIVVVLTTLTVGQLCRLARLAATIRTGRVVVLDGGVGRLLASSIRSSIAIASGTLAVYIGQENVERAGVGGVPPGLEVVSGELGIALPVISLISLAIGTLAALARWRRAVLVARIGRARASVPARPPRALRPPIDARAPAATLAGWEKAVRGPPGLTPQGIHPA